MKTPILIFCLLCCSSAFAELPEGANGIAAKFPGDAGIEKDKRVVFVEQFDQPEVKTLLEQWENSKAKGFSFSKESAPGSADGQSLLMTHTGGDGTGGALYRRLLPGHEKLFARWYVKFDPDCFNIHHFGTHLGGFNPPTPWPQGGAGERPDGAKRFTSGVEPFGKSWSWDFYSYWQGMRRHGDGNYWGTPFLTNGSKPKVEKNKWICVEMMMKMNDVGKLNGEQAFWIDGKLWRRDGQVVSHAGPGFPKGNWRGGWWEPDAKAENSFEGFEWRTTDEISINYLWTYVYITKAPKGHVSRVWFDNIVVATDYIGPIQPKEK
ncbi:MAG: hypothetical protein HKN23_05820 [Verrucomicrobiales bacterium]|nr:hypothetical protein [Verrucomicrobiales bacterium]